MVPTFDFGVLGVLILLIIELFKLPPGRDDADGEPDDVDRGWGWLILEFKLHPGRDDADGEPFNRKR